jgi:uracil-DNA glycosylase
MSPSDTIIQQSEIHPQWHAPLQHALASVDPAYLQQLLDQPDWLPGCTNLFAAFRRDLKACRYILIGESPYPRKQSANGIAFYDAAVNELWSDNGLSKAVNRATSLRNILKTSLLAEGLLQPDGDGKITQPMIAALDKSRLIQTLPQLFDRLSACGFLMFNATPVLFPDRSVTREARYWQPFLANLLDQIAQHAPVLPTLVLWGKIAQEIAAMPQAQAFPQLVSEHPYNISFIDNPDMRALFAELKLLSSL